MASTENALMKTAEKYIAHLSRPEESGLAKFRRNRRLPSPDKIIEPQIGRRWVRHYFAEAVPEQWDTFVRLYQAKPFDVEAGRYLSSVNIYAQLGWVLASEMITPGFEQAVEMSVLMLDFNIEKIARPVEPDEFSTPYEGGVVPFFDITGAARALPGESSHYFDDVLIRTTRLMLGLCVEHKVPLIID